MNKTTEIAEARARAKAHDLLTCAESNETLDRARKFACGWTSRWAKIACHGLEGDGHSGLCDSLTYAFDDELQLHAAALAKVTAELTEARAEVKRLMAENVRVARDAERFLVERDGFEEQIGDIVASVGLECEWSNLHGHADCVGEAFAAIDSERDAVVRDLEATRGQLAEAVRHIDVAWTLRHARDCVCVDHENMRRFLAALAQPATTPALVPASTVYVDSKPPVTEEQSSCGGCGRRSAPWEGWQRPDEGACWWLWEPAFQMWTFLCRDEREDEATPALVTTPEACTCPFPRTKCPACVHSCAACETARRGLRTGPLVAPHTRRVVG